VIPPVTRAPRIGIPHLSGSSGSYLSSARRRAIQAVEKEVALPQLQWERAGLNAPKASTPRRIPLAGAEILRRYERSSASTSKPDPLTPVSPATSQALRNRAVFASRLRGNSPEKSSSSEGLTRAEKARKKSVTSAAKSDSDLAQGAGVIADAGPIALDSDIRNATKSLSNGDDSGAGSSGDGWDDNFGDGSGGDSSGDDGSGDDGCDDNCNDDNCHDDHWHDGHHGHWGWWGPSWGWHSSWGFYASWYSWYSWPGWWMYPWYSPYYIYSPNWNASYYSPSVVSSTIYTTEIIEIPVVQEVHEPLDHGLIGGAQANSSAEVRSALERAAVEYLSLGDRAFAEARYGDAVRHYARAVECSPEDPVLHLVLSDALFATGDYHYAAHCLRRALELEPNLLEVEFDKRSFYGDPSDFDRHILLLESYLADHVLDDDARLILGANQLFSSDPEATVELFSDPLGQAVQDSNEGRLLLAAAHRAIAAR